MRRIIATAIFFVLIAASLMFAQNAYITSNTVAGISFQSGFTSAFRNFQYSTGRFTWTGAVGAVTWTISAGTLPTGLSLGSSTTNANVIAGTPTVSGASTFTIHGVDSASPAHTVSQVVTVTVYISTGVTVSPSVTLQQGATQQMVAMSTESDSVTTLNVTNVGVWSCTGTGCGSITAGGLFTAALTNGTATPKNTFDSQNGTATITVQNNNPAPTITNAATLPAPCDVLFTCPTTQLLASGGTPPYTWSITSGAPTGCAASVSSAGAYSCTPTASGTFSAFIIKVTDSAAQTASKTFTQVVGSVSSVNFTVTSNSVVQNSSVQGTATAVFSDAGTQNVTQGSGIGQSVFASSNGFPVQSLQITGLTIPAGVQVTLCASNETNNTVVMAFTDSAAQSYSSIAFNQGYGTDRESQCVRKTNSAALTSVRACLTSCTTPSGTASEIILIAKWTSGLSDTLDGTPVKVGSSALSNASSQQAGPLTTTNANDQICIYQDVSANQTGYTAPSGFSIPANAFNQRDAIACQTVSATQTALAPTMSWSTANISEAGNIMWAFQAGSSTGATWSSAPGTGNCSVNASGLITGTSQGTCTVTAAYGGHSANQTITVTAPTDASLVVSPNPGSGTVGSTVQFTARGNSTGNVYTTGVGWAPTNQAVATSAGNGLFNCVTAASTTVTASFSGLTAGTATINCSNSVSGTSLLNGCTVSTSNAVQGCTGIPAGWSLITAEGFDSGSLGNANEELAFSTITSANFHNGSRSMLVAIPTLSSCPAPPCSFGGGLIAHGLTGTYHDIYMSQWRYLDSQAKGDAEAFFMFIGTTNGTGQGLVMDTEAGSSATNMSLWFSPQSCCGPDPPGTGSGVNSVNGSNDSFYGPGWPLPLGRWEQEEIWIHPNTCTGGVNNLDGSVHFYINGVEQRGVTFPVGSTASTLGTTAGNINGCLNMTTNLTANFESTWTYFSGTTPAFGDYRDDIILMAK